MSNKEKIFTFFKATVILLGCFSFIFSVAHMDARVFDWRFVGFAVFALLIGSRMSITLPNSKFVLSFSDLMIFLTFLLFGGEAAIFIATLEMLSTCLFLKYSGVYIQRINIVVNISITALSTAITYCVYIVIPQILGLGSNFSVTSVLFSTLGILALSQFFFSSCFASIFFALKNNKEIQDVWRKEFYSSSLTYVVGAGLAGVVYKLINFGEIIPIFISLTVFAVV